MKTHVQENKTQSFAERIRLHDRIIWILLVFFIWYEIIGGSFDFMLQGLFSRLSVSNSMAFVLNYTSTLGGTIAFFLLCLYKKNRPVPENVLPSRKKRSFSYLGAGLLLGFMTNFFCILCAMLHGDIKLIFDFHLSGIPLMLFALFSVFIQSSTEEIWTRGFLYDRVNVHYPLWLAIVVNGVAFGLLHAMNPGITPLAMADLIFCGISYSLLRWYTGSIWICMGVHTMWNFTQNFIFGLPNSGLVSETSIFHLDAANGMSNLIYDHVFGVEGALPAVFMDILLGALCLYLGWKKGRLGELLLSKESKEKQEKLVTNEE